MYKRQILEQMEKDGTEFVWEDLRTIPENELNRHFPNIVEHCRKIGLSLIHISHPQANIVWSSYKERRVDALALRADERRDKLRKASGRS